MNLRELVEATKAVAKLDIPPVESGFDPRAIALRLLDLLTPCDDDLATVDDELREFGNLLEFGSIIELWKLSGEKDRMLTGSAAYFQNPLATTCQHLAQNANYGFFVTLTGLGKGF